MSLVIFAINSGCENVYKHIAPLASYSIKMPIPRLLYEIPGRKPQNRILQK